MSASGGVVTGAKDDSIRLFLAGDVMTGRGIDQIQRRSCDPQLHEPHVQDAGVYVEIAERANGPVPAPVPPEYIWGEGLEVLQEKSPDVRIVNLETSITTSDNFWRGKLIHYRMHPENVDCLTAADLDVCALANNHVLDWGQEGLVETLEVLEEAGIAYAGAGRTMEGARRPVRMKVRGDTSVVIWSVATGSSGVPGRWEATRSRPGIYRVELTERDAGELAASVKAHKRPGDVAVVSIHWGSNWGWEVPEAQVRFAHRLADAGVDVIHGHSSHHVRPVEQQGSTTIMYGCGDLITDYEGIGGHEQWRGDLGAMYFADVAAGDGAVERLELVPTQVRKMQLARPGDEDVRWVVETLNRISGRYDTSFELRDDGIIELVEDTP